MQDVADQQLEARIDNYEYDESQLIEVRVAMNLPYQQRFTDFERHYGEIEIDGKSYTYVKRKVEGDVVIFKCISNQAKQELNNIKNDMARANSSVETPQNGKQQQQTSFAKNFWSEYDGDPEISITAFSTLTKTALSDHRFYLSIVNLNTPHQPPEC